MRCSVFDCTSDTKTTSKCQGTTFHLFPKEPKLRAMWLQALGMINWKPKDRDTICSEHFRDEDFYETKSGLRKIKSGALPMMAKDCSKLDEPAASRVCRICLAIDVKMYDIGDYNLDDMYEQITGIQIIGEERLPQRLCYECEAWLSSAIRFKNRATRSLELLQEILLRDDDHVITIRDIMSLKYAHNNSKSPLVQKVFENRDIFVKDEKMECSEGGLEDEGKDVEEDSESELKNEESIEEIFIKEEETYEEENDKKLSGEEDGEDSCNDDAKRNRDKEYDEDIQSITDMYKNNNVKRRAGRSADDMSLFNVKSLRRNVHSEITIRDVISLNYAHDNSKSPLVQKVFENRDIFVKDEKMECSEGGLEDERKDVAEDSESKLRNEDSIEEIFIKEEESSEEENDKELSGEEDGEDSCNDDAKRNRDKEYDEDIQSITDMYKKKNVKRPAGRSADLDMSLFTVTPLSYEQQIEEVRERQHSASYLEAPYKCTVCFRGCKDKNSYEAHALKHTKIFGLHECLVCKTRQKSLKALRKHLNARHTELYSCNDCSFLSKNRSVAREHQKWHAGTIYKCEHCGEEFGKRSTYLGHTRLKHKSDFVCELCGYTFLGQKGIDVHKQKKHVLDQDMPLEGPHCDVCEVKFMSEVAFYRHLKLSARHSSNDDPNRLRNSFQSLNRKPKSRMKSRIERHPVIDRLTPEDVLEPNDPISCEQCNLELPNTRSYAQHFKRSHPDKNRTKFPTKRMPCVCNLCGKIFSMMALLDAHMWVHTGVKRYKCNLCMKRFSQKAYLAGHLRAHNGERPTYECPICGKHFSRDNNRKRHMFLHTGLKPFKCEICGKSSATVGEQKTHFEHVHEKKPWPKRNRSERYRARRDEKRDTSDVED